MEEYVSKEEVKGFVRSGISTDTEADKEYVCAFIDSIPPADVRPNIHGHWIEHKEHCENLGAIPSGLGAFKWCSNCDCGIDVREWHRNNYNYCPNCGADMKGE